MVGYEKDKTGLSNSKYILAGATAGIITRAIAQPLDVIKIKFQLQVEPMGVPSSKYYSIVQACKTIFREEGLRGLWAGHWPGQILSVTYGLVNFGTFEYLTSHYSVEKTATSHFVCGTISSCLATFASFPFDTIRTRFIAQGHKKGGKLFYKSMLQGMTTMLKHEGIRGPFKGLTPAIIQGAPLGGLTFVFHHIVSKFINENKYLSSGSKTLNLSGNFIAGSMAGFLAKTLVYPMDVARKRMQLQGFQQARQGYGVNFYCIGLIDCGLRTLKNEGFLGIYKGWIPSVFKATLTTALHFTVYEETCKLLGKI